ncbi:DUF5665 domain-containing protein [Roseovarius amoyensis]|uniref:DUF5665 domain-containing protein n=1 Tax=Roseovarius amoyensis TaxID=2211448 RepID=UPI000DBE1367|nr:DUF5665 domain-containing protein [Roseovarius amoyensis]
MSKDQQDETDPQAELCAELQALRAELVRLNGHRFLRLHASVPKMLAFNLARGLAFGLGTVLGASVLLSLVAWFLSQVEFLPIIGEWAAEIVRQMQSAAGN